MKKMNTTKRVSLAVAVLLVAMLGSACSTQSKPIASAPSTPLVQAPPSSAPISAPVPAPAPLPVKPPTPVAPPPPSPAPEAAQEKIITMTDNNKSVSLLVDESFLLKLGGNYDWSVTIDDQSVVSRKIGIMVVQGAQGIFEAKKTGTAVLTAVGDLPCRKSVPACMAPSILFRLTVNVEK